MAFQRPFLISLRRDDSREPWGFRLDGGGVTDRPVTVQQVLEHSLAEKAGLHDGDQVIQIGRINVQGRTLSEVQELILTCRNRVEMFIIREDLLRNRKENEPLTVKAVVHSPYNSPFHLYSQDNVADTLATQACILTDPELQLNHLGPKSPPTVIQSDVWKALREQGEKGHRLNGEVITRPTAKKKQPPPVPPKPRPPARYHPESPPVRASIFPGNMEQVQYQNLSSYHEEKRTTSQRTTNYEEYEEEEEETEEEEEEEPVVITQTQKTFKSQTSFTPGQQQQSDVRRTEQRTQQQTIRTQQTIQQDTQQRQAEIARQQQQQAYEQQQRQLREQQQRQAYEQQQRQIREQQLREQQAREQQAREQQARQQQAREQQAREQQAREQQARQQQAREQQAREQQAREQQARQAAQQRQAYEQQQAREAYEKQQRQAQLQAQQAYEQQQRQAQQQRQTQPRPRPQPTSTQQGQPQYYNTEPDKKFTSTTRIVPANLGSPTAQRRGGCPSWPPKNSSVRELPKTGFSPSFVKERGSKQFVWPPPSPDDMISHDPGSPRVHGHAADGWHPQETPTVPRPLVPRSPTPTRRSGDSIWPPRHTLVNENAELSRPMPRPVCRRGKFDDYISNVSSSNVPPTYRLPPGTVHVNIAY